MSTTGTLSEKRPVFLSSNEFAAVKTAFGEFSGTPEYVALERYYQMASEPYEASEKLPPVKSFRKHSSRYSVKKPRRRRPSLISTMWASGNMPPD